MWMLGVLVIALALGLAPRLPERTARLAVVPVIVAMVGYQALKYGML